MPTSAKLPSGHVIKQLGQIIVPYADDPVLPGVGLPAEHALPSRPDREPILQRIPRELLCQLADLDGLLHGDPEVGGLGPSAVHEPVVRLGRVGEVEADGQLPAVPVDAEGVAVVYPAFDQTAVIEDLPGLGGKSELREAYPD